MKVQINMKFASKIEASPTTFSLTVSPADTVLAIKERIASAHMIAFPDQDLLLNGEVLADEQKACDCGVKEGLSLDFVVKASEGSLVKQLAELLQARDLSCDELGLLYCYKNGISVKQALLAVGHEGKFEEFMKQQKAFLIENGRATLVREDTKMKPFSAVEEVKKILAASDTGSMDITSLCSRFVQKFNVSISSIAGMKPAEFLASEKDLFVVTGRGLVTLKSVHDAQRHAQRDAPCEVQRERAPLGIQRDAPWRKEVPVPSQQRQVVTVDEAKQPVQNGVAPSVVNKLAPSKPDAQGDSQQEADGQEYLDLHNKISGRSFNSKVAQALNTIVDTVSEAMFLNIDHVVKGGSVGKGTAIAGVTDAQVVFFLNGMPNISQSKWLPALLKSVASVLSENLSAELGCGGVRLTDDSLQLRVKDLVTVDLRFSPVFENYSDIVQTMSGQTPEGRRYCDASLAKEKVQFIAKQPGQVKITMRLLKWWREQQEWSCALRRPSDELLELMAIYSAVQTKPIDQRAAVANVMSLLARFDELRIVWSNYYGTQDVWSPLLKQRPLLMDPVNPCINVADPQSFDSCELVALARSTHFFW